jgi:hypothetical protein
MKEHVKKYLVDIIESERGWGQKVDETLEFDTEQEAKDYCRKYNSKNTEESVPDWYMYASYRGLI